MAKSVDLELRKAFNDLQVKTVETKKKIRLIDSQISTLVKMLALTDLTYQKVITLPPNTKTYESVGRMFLLTELDQVQNNLRNSLDLISARIHDYENNKQYLESNVKESKNNIREMVQHKKEELS
ncbi:prefoldin subunit 1 [Battus philenor]|uniref:prefoldin subunit 1 n=1 Tax=Battus philenor TaxID=42288 RepID=UPI0035CF2B28